jgi:cytochrome c5
MVIALRGRASLFAALALALSACSGTSGGESGSCPADLPAACSGAPPSYHADVAPLIERRCLACHGDGGVAQARHDFTRYDILYSQRASILDHVFACAMPPAGNPALTPEERKVLLTWLVCRAPNN